MIDLDLTESCQHPEDWREAFPGMELGRAICRLCSQVRWLRRVPQEAGSTVIVSPWRPFEESDRLGIVARVGS